MLMSKSAYAKHRGVSRQTVYDWIAKGKIVMSGSKIDVEATERLNGNVADTGQWEHRTLEMTWGEFWNAVQARDGKAPPPSTDEEIRQYLESAADELGWSVEFLEDGGVYLDDGDAEHYVIRYDFTGNAEIAIQLMRHELRSSASKHPDEPDNWSPAGLKALSTWLRADFENETSG